MPPAPCFPDPQHAVKLLYNIGSGKMNQPTMSTYSTRIESPSLRSTHLQDPAYGARLRFALALSIAAHVLGAFYVSLSHSSVGVVPKAPPLVVRLQPQKTPPMRLVDVTHPSETPQTETQNIAEANAQASGTALTPPEEKGLPDVRESDSSSTVTPSTPPIPPISQEKSEPQRLKTAARTPPLQTSPRRIEAPKGQPQTALPERGSIAASPSTPETAVEDTPQDALAMLTPANPPVAETESSAAARGEVGNEIKSEGFLSYAAMQHEIAPYLQEIRKAVERHWKAGLLTRYKGTQRRQATLDCAIRPDGTLEYVRVVGAPQDPIFAGICHDAIVRAAPFRPFPFRVPDLYRNKNLEIRWTFSFL